jgi:nucleotide-binding universal stress UspA family protein
MTDPQRIVLGLDLTPRSHGALGFAAWLRDSGPHVVLQGVHLIDGGDDDDVQRAHGVLHRVLTALELGDVFDEIVVRASDGLHADLARQAAGAWAVVLGRKTRTGERALSHLGPVARYMVRSLPAPVIIVPPELDRDQLRGQVLVATDLQPHSDAAAGFAAGLAAAHERMLTLVHILAPDGRGGSEAEFAAWAAARGLAGARRLTERGAPADVLPRLAVRERAAMIVLGSRRLSRLARIFTTSTSATVASHAPCPVAIVPTR